MPTPPTPRHLPLLGHIPQFHKDVLGLLTRAVSEHGDFVRFKLGMRSIYLVNHPDDVQQILRKNARNFDKDTRTTRFLRDICGESLLTTNGEEWERRRHLLQPAFHRKAVEGFATIMHEEAAAIVARLQGRSRFDAAAAMMATTFRVVARALFGTALPDSLVTTLEAPIGIVLRETFARHGSLLGRNTRAFKEAMRQLDQAVASILSSTHSSMETPDLLALMRIGDYDDQDLRNESITFLLAGHETTANALIWLLAFLAERPDEQTRCAHDPAALDRAIQETLRLAPPIWIIERHAIASAEVAGYTIPAGASVVVCPYTLHRHPEFWKEPDQFDPNRFLAPPPAAYMPFGIGPRFCIGRDFSLMEARIIAGALLQAFEFTPVSSSPPVAEPAITLRIRSGLELNLRTRPS